MKRNDANQDFEDSLKTEERFFALFYASWCPFSRMFLPIYRDWTKNSPVPCIRVMVDNREDLCEKYAIDTYPTVLFFENGKVAKRLDGEQGIGLSEKQLKKILGSK